MITERGGLEDRQNVTIGNAIVPLNDHLVNPKYR